MTGTGIFSDTGILFFDGTEFQQQFTRCPGSPIKGYGYGLIKSRSRWRKQGMHRSKCVLTQVEPEHGRQIRQRPFGFRQVMHPFEEQDGDQGCPNPDAQCIFAGADESLHFKVLLQRFEEEFDFSTIFIDGGYFIHCEILPHEGTVAGFLRPYNIVEVATYARQARVCHAVKDLQRGCCRAPIDGMSSFSKNRGMESLTSPKTNVATDTYASGIRERNQETCTHALSIAEASGKSLNAFGHSVAVFRADYKRDC